MILRARNDFGDVVAIGSGMVYAKDRDYPYREFTANGKLKLSFLLSVGCKKMLDPTKHQEDSNKKAYVFRYETIQCQIDLKSTNRNMYAACKTMRVFDRVDFKGVFFEDNYTDKDGVERTATVLRIESVFFPEKTAVLLNGSEVTKNQMRNQAILQPKPLKTSEKQKYYFE